jgi:hypothetical protein
VRVPESGRGRCLTLCARGRLALAGDDLERDVEAAALVPREPDVTHSARTQGPQGPVAAQDELVRKGR